MNNEQRILPISKKAEKTENNLCICGKKLKRRQDGKMGTTCGNKSCAGLRAKEHMKEVLKTSSVNCHYFPPKKECYPFWEHKKR